MTMTGYLFLTWLLISDGSSNEEVEQGKHTEYIFAVNRNSALEETIQSCSASFKVRQIC